MALITKRNVILKCGFHHWIEQTKLLFLVIKFLKINESKGVICWEEVSNQFTLYNHHILAADHQNGYYSSLWYLIRMILSPLNNKFDTLSWENHKKPISNRISLAKVVLKKSAIFFVAMVRDAWAQLKNEKLVGSCILLFSFFVFFFVFCHFTNLVFILWVPFSFEKLQLCYM